MGYAVQAADGMKFRSYICILFKVTKIVNQQVKGQPCKLLQTNDLTFGTVTMRSCKVTQIGIKMTLFVSRRLVTAFVFNNLAKSLILIEGL